MEPKSKSSRSKMNKPDIKKSALPQKASKIQSKIQKDPLESNIVEAEEEEEEVKVLLPSKRMVMKKSIKGPPQMNNMQAPLPSNRRNNIPMKSNSNEVFNQETEIEEKKSNETDVATTGAPPSVSIFMKFAMNYLLLNSSITQEVPCSVELQGSEDPNGKRSGIDIVCVIDVSGSMSGDKLTLVQKTLLFMIKKLDVTDRVSLITFSDDAKVLSNLLTMNPNGKENISGIVNRMQIEGGTEIILGVDSAMSLLSKRKTINKVTSILLLTDGIDNNGNTAMKRLEKLFVKYDPLIASTYSIHAFGYGKDHQADLLNSVSSKKSGGFYFVEKEESIPQAFSDCLGEMMSIIADSIFIELTTQPGTVQYSMTKVYSESGDTSFRMPPVLAGEKKEAIFLLSFPPSTDTVPENHKEYPVKARVSYTLTLTGEKIVQDVILEVPVLNENDKSKEIAIDEDVMVNFHRSKAAEILREAAVLGDRGDMANARNLIIAGSEEIKNSAVASHPTVVKIINDFASSVPRFQDRNAYEHGGKADLKSKANNHYNKRAMYKNKMQSKLLQEAEDEI